MLHVCYEAGHCPNVHHYEATTRQPTVICYKYMY